MSATMTLLNRTRTITRTVQSQEPGQIRFADLIHALSESLGARVAIISRKGKVLATAEQTGLIAGGHINESLNRMFLALDTATTLKDVEVAGDSEKGPFSVTSPSLFVLPVFGGGDRLGSLLVNKLMDEEDLILAEYAIAVVGLELLRAHQEEDVEESRKFETARTAVTSLSYSEMEVLSQVFDSLKGNEGLVVASKIADKAGITRSVIVNGLRKLESAGVITSRSLGMKGTFIKILNPFFLTQLHTA